MRPKRAAQKGRKKMTVSRSNPFVQCAIMLVKVWRLGERDTARILGFSQKDDAHVASILAGEIHLRDRDVLERIAHLLWIQVTLSSLFREPDTENDWLRESHSQLGDRTPMDLLLDGSMEDLLTVRDYVDSAAGL